MNRDPAKARAALERRLKRARERETKGPPKREPDPPASRPGAQALLSAALSRMVTRALEREPGLTRTELASRMLPDAQPDVARTQLGRYLAGTRWPTAERLDAIATVLGCSVAELFEETETCAHTKNHP